MDQSEVPNDPQNKPSPKPPRTRTRRTNSQRRPGTVGGMGICCKGACPSPPPDHRTQESKPSQGSVRAVTSAKLEIVTMNVNSWKAFRDKWTTEGVPQELTTAHVIYIQEHRLESTQECDDAIEWCGARGFNAVFKRASALESGRASCGVAILVAQRDDFGVSELVLTLTTEEAPRIMALQLAIPGMDPMMLINTYFEDPRGLSELNRQLLAKMASWQQEFAMPITGGDDFNI